ncbi:MAG TPA: universal stress protein [Solirubrobacteraceae bacterium]|jgi:nucleotide-binding universal stress UspA family protein
MTPKAVVSYDDTPNDHDALMLARVLSDAGVELILAYVRHTTEIERERERLEEHEAHALLERGARTLGDLDVERRVVLSGSTAEGLSWLAEREEAQIVVFGSDYRTAAGHVSLQKSTQTLLDGGSAALAIAPANYRSEHARTFGRLGLLASLDDDAALETAHDLAESLGARVARDEPHVDLLVIGSRPEASHHRLLISGSAQNAIDNAASPVLVLPRGACIRFPLVVGA